MELMLAGFACEAWKAMVRSMDDTVTDGALLHTFKFLVKVAFPYSYRFC